MCFILLEVEPFVSNKVFGFPTISICLKNIYVDGAVHNLAK